ISCQTSQILYPRGTRLNPSFISPSIAPPVSPPLLEDKMSITTSVNALAARRGVDLNCILYRWYSNVWTTSNATRSSAKTLNTSKSVTRMLIGYHTKVPSTKAQESQPQGQPQNHISPRRR